MKLKKLNLKNYFKKNEIVTGLKFTGKDINVRDITKTKYGFYQICYEEILYFDKTTIDKDGKETTEKYTAHISIPLKLDLQELTNLFQDPHTFDKEELKKALKNKYSILILELYNIKDEKDLEIGTYARDFYEQNKDIFEYDKKIKI